MSIKISPKLQQVLNYDTTSFTKDELKKHGLSETEIVLYYRLKSVQCALNYEEENKVILTEDGLKRFGLGEEERNLYHVIKKQQEKTDKKSLPKAMNKIQSTWKKLKVSLWVVIGISICILIPMLIGLFVHGGAWLGAKIYPLLIPISLLTLAIVILVLIPMSFIKGTRRHASIGLLIASYVFGLTLWVWGLLLTYHLWGGWAVFIGLFILGIGVVPIAMLATIFKGMWPQLVELIILTILVFGVRAYSLYLAQKADQETIA